MEGFRRVFPSVSLAPQPPTLGYCVHTSPDLSALVDFAPPSPQLWGSQAFNESSMSFCGSLQKRNSRRFTEFKVPQSWGIQGAQNLGAKPRGHNVPPPLQRPIIALHQIRHKLIKTAKNCDTGIG
jgi:hypothetical protein